MKVSKECSRPGEPRRREKSGHGKNANKQGALTFWRVQMERQVRTLRECESARGTHHLESPDRGTRQGAECEREIDEGTGEEISTY